jgi:hypothetical protein
MQIKKEIIHHGFESERNVILQGLLELTAQAFKEKAITAEDIEARVRQLKEVETAWNEFEKKSRLVKGEEVTVE